MTIAPERPGTATADPYKFWYCTAMPKARRELSPEDPRHGTVNGYGNFGCRCGPCKDAKAEESRSYNARTVKQRKARYEANATHYREKARVYAEENREKVKAYRSAWYRANAERILAKQKANPHPERTRKNHLFRLYGMTPAEYDAMLHAQGGRCAICGNGPEGRSKHNRLSVDHCHETGRVRGLLCGLCNVALGGFGDDVDVLRRAAEYLERGP